MAKSRLKQIFLVVCKVRSLRDPLIHPTVSSSCHVPFVELGGQAESADYCQPRGDVNQQGLVGGGGELFVVSR